MPAYMDRAGGDLLARAGFAQDEHGVALAVRDQFDHSQGLAHRGTLSDHRDGLGILVEEVVFVSDAVGGLAGPHRPSDAGGDLVQTPAILHADEIVGNAGPFIFHLGEGRGVHHRHDGHRHRMDPKTDAVQEAADVTRRDCPVEQRQIGRYRFDHVTGLGQVVRNEHLVGHFLGQAVNVRVSADDRDSSKYAHTTPMSLSRFWCRVASVPARYRPHRLPISDNFNFYWTGIHVTSGASRARQG